MSFGYFIRSISTKLVLSRYWLFECDDIFEGSVVKTKQLKDGDYYLYRFEMSVDVDVVISNNMDTKAQV